MRIIKADGVSEKLFMDELRARADETAEKAAADVRRIIADVKASGDAAIRKYTKKFDGATLKSFEIDPSEMEAAALRLDDRLLLALENAAENIRLYHERQVIQSSFNTNADGGMTGRRILPLKRVGIYAPGGTAAYPSSVLMNAIPARVAGVSEIILATPLFQENATRDLILAAAYIAGVTRVFTMGGAQAVAALAYGTQSVPRVDKITGPGNIYVTTAKKQVYGTVGIDMTAGPSEILIIADDGANPVYAAADLLSQAEHDILASATLLCLSEEFANKVSAELKKQFASLSRRETAQQSLENYGCIIVCQNISAAAEIANNIAPEHLELLCENPFQKLGLIENAGSIFLGEYSPEPLGDYMAGTNHVLPTSGTARFFSPLSVDDFVKKSGVIYGSRESLAATGGDIITLAKAEGLDAHANSIKVRKL